MGNKSQTFAEVFPMIGFLLLFLVVPPLLARLAQIKFARRFERLVRQGHVEPVLIRNEDDACHPITGRKRVTMRSFLETWIDVPSSSKNYSKSTVSWKPIAAAHINLQNDNLAKDDILTSVRNKKDAASFLKTVRHRRLPKTHDEVYPTPGPAIQEKIPGIIRYATLISLPSLSHPQFQGTVGDKKAQRRTTNSSLLTSSRISPEVRTSFQGGIEHDISVKSTQMPLPLLEIGVAEVLYEIDRETLDQVGGDGSESITSVERNNYIPIFASRGRIHLNPVMYGTRSQIVVRQGRANPLLANTRTRIY